MGQAQSAGTEIRRGSEAKGAVKPGDFVHHNQGSFSSRYKGVKVLGKGSFGEVILCKDKVTGQQVAVKVISKKQAKHSDTLIREVQLLKELDHPNIMTLHEFFEDAGYYYLVGEVYSGGELFDEIISRKRFDEADAARVCKEVLSGMAYMHRRGIVHRDLKPENLLLESKGAMGIKIIDFGLSTHFVGNRKMKDKIGTAYYIAPEVLHGVYDEKCDVWSAGVILYILLSGSPPFNGATESDILKRVEKGRYTFDTSAWQAVSAEAKDLIRSMLTYIPAMRPDAQTCLAHKWFDTVRADDHTLKTTKSQLPALATAVDNIRAFQSYQRLTQAAVLFIGSKLTSREEREPIKKLFLRLDRNADGVLDREELIAGYASILESQGRSASSGLVEAQVDEMLRGSDQDGTGTLEYGEFLAVALDRAELLGEERLKRCFQAFDRNGDGKISSEELGALFGLTADIDNAEWKAVLESVDKDKSGDIDFAEFKAMLESLIK